MIVVDSLQLSPPIHHDHRRERVGSESGARGARRRGPASPIWPGFRSRSHNPALDREAGPTIRTKSETDQPRGPAAATRASIWPMTETGPTLWSSRPNCGRRPGSGPASRSGFGTGAAIRVRDWGRDPVRDRGRNPLQLPTGEQSSRLRHRGRNPDRPPRAQSGPAGRDAIRSGRCCLGAIWRGRGRSENMAEHDVHGNLAECDERRNLAEPGTNAGIYTEPATNPGIRPSPGDRGNRGRKEWRPALGHAAPLSARRPWPKTRVGRKTPAIQAFSRLRRARLDAVRASQ